MELYDGEREMTPLERCDILNAGKEKGIRSKPE